MRTVRRRLNEKGLAWLRKAKKPALTHLQRVRRLLWARQWRSFDFGNVVWTDEKRFRLRPDGPAHTWRFRHERFQAPHVAGQHKFGGGSVMVWGAMDRNGVVALHLCSDNMDKWEYQGLLLSLLRVRPDLSRAPAMAAPRATIRRRDRPLLMHDNASCHTAKLVEGLLECRGVTLLPWPACSPDLNPIENLWAKLVRGMEGRTFHSKEATWAAVEAEWQTITPAFCGALVASMPSRLTAVVRAVGGPTRY